MPHILRNALWLGFFGTILLAWAWLYMMATGMGLDLLGRMQDMAMPMDNGMSGQMSEGMSGQMAEGAGMGMDMTSFTPLFAMWAVMMAAMMLPTMVPTLRAYEDLIRSADGTRGGWAGVLAGYFLVWVAFAALITGVQLLLLEGGVISMMGAANNAFVAAALLIVVGLFQFTRAKEICHGVCHSPMTYFLGHWRPDTVGGLRMGLGLGAYCVGCCWGFMALGFVGGVMSLLWMGLATLFMVIEKLPQVGHHVTRPMGAILIAAGFALAIWAM